MASGYCVIRGKIEVEKCQQTVIEVTLGIANHSGFHVYVGGFWEKYLRTKVRRVGDNGAPESSHLSIEGACWRSGTGLAIWRRRHHCLDWARQCDQRCQKYRGKRHDREAVSEPSSDRQIIPGSGDEAESK